MPRNKELMRVFRDVEFVEALGSGMRRIMRNYGRENFEFGENYIRFKVKYNVPESVLESVEGKGIELSERQKVILSELIKTGQQNVLENVLENTTETSKSLADFCKVNERTIRRDLAKLQEIEYIRRVGPDKGGKWLILKK